MGSITGRPKAPSQPVQQIVYVPATTAETTSPSTDGTAPTEEEALQNRAENILKSSRSRLGTVLTSFKGVLSQNDLVAPRKTLLGE